MTDAVSRAANIDAAPIPANVATYLRVSTGRQAEGDLSIPDQRRQIQNYCATKNWNIVQEFVEPGSSATDDRRAAFQSMIDAALEKPATFTVIIVHSFSRFFRDQFQFEFYVRKLAKNGVRLISITQDLGDDPMSVMMRQIMTLFDEYQSKENGKHTLRAMKENARQGFWNGSLPPIGYRVVSAGLRGTKTKKALEIDPIHADTVRLIFQLSIDGVGDTGPLGVKSIATYLNERNISTRDGGRWGLSAVHKILKRESYIGRHHFNTRNFKTKTLKPATEHAIMQVPPIVTEAEFNAVQRILKSRNPRSIPPRTVSGPVLLTGICFCSTCGGAMTLRTGKNGRYRYYTCSTRKRVGETGCCGRTVPMATLDRAVTAHLESRLLDPQRITRLLHEILQKRTEWIQRRQGHIGDLRKRATEAEMKLNRLYDAIENGVIDASDPSLKNRVAELSAVRDQARADAARAVATLERSGPVLTEEGLKRFALAARRKLRNEDGTYRRDHLRALVQRVEVVNKSEARITGTKSELFQVLVAAKSVESAGAGVLTFVPKWRALGESNPSCKNENLES